MHFLQFLPILIPVLEIRLAAAQAWIRSTHGPALLAYISDTRAPTAPVEKITVKEIVETCGLTRQTFYRNFQDKYDLINWYFDKILLESFEHMGEGRTVYESLVNKFEYIQMEQLFFRAAFKRSYESHELE